jgi:hypothetical protein
MRHPSTKQLFDWNLRRDGRCSRPRRHRPGAICGSRGYLHPALDEAAGHPFRIAGTRICAAFGRELKGESFLNLWDASSRGLVRDLTKVVGNEVIGALANVRSTSSVGTHEIELLLLPITYRGFPRARILGALTPRDPAHWVDGQTLTTLSLGGFRYLSPNLEVAPSIVPERPDGRIRHGFVVYDGGRPSDTAKL